MEASNQPFLLTLAPSIINNVISHQGKDNNLIFVIKLLALQGHQAVPICFFLLPMQFKILHKDHECKHRILVSLTPCSIRHLVAC